ncbi:MAG: hypothetical protein E6R03_00175 [Hyphomicrobiaceae bacterium]|nr:MAG: hypothetical protein E6R03_00175 [Hyphomicrobiaceae bacterium]
MTHDELNHKCQGLEILLTQVQHERDFLARHLHAAASCAPDRTLRIPVKVLADTPMDAGLYLRSAVNRATEEFMIIATDHRAAR